MHLRQPTAEILRAVVAEPSLSDRPQRERRRIAAHLEDLRDPDAIRLGEPAEARGLHLIVLAPGAGPRLFDHPHLTAGLISSRRARHERSTISTTSAKPSSPP